MVPSPPIAFHVSLRPLVRFEHARARA